MDKTTRKAIGGFLIFTGVRFLAQTLLHFGVDRWLEEQAAKTDNAIDDFLARQASVILNSLADGHVSTTPE